MAANKLSFLLEIPKRASACAKGGEVLTAGKEYYSVLTENDQGGVLRKDFCCECWKESVKQELGLSATSYWKSQVPEKKKGDSLPQERDLKALELLKEMLGSGDSITKTEAFVLALYLARKKKIFLRQQLNNENGSIWFVYEVASTEEMLSVPKCELANIEISEVQQILAKKLL